MTIVDYSIELSEPEMDEYLDVAFFAISKGTANVSARDKKKLRPLMRHYAKMKHPFAACVRDNRKRFGAHTEEYCAVLKDLIVGSTKWRGKGKKYTPKNLAESFEDLNLFLTDELEFENEVPEGFLEYLNQLTDEDINIMTGDTIISQNSNFASGDVVWKPERSYDYIRRELQEVLNESYSEPSSGQEVGGYSYWVEDIQDGQALVCHKYNDYYIVPFSSTKSGISVGDEESWIAVEKAWVETHLAEEPQILAELFFDDSDEIEFADGKENVIWKTIMREGTWNYSPGPGQMPMARPIKVVSEGKSDPKSLVISLQELKENFDAGVKDHVTIPTSHADKVYENTGFIDELKIDQDSKGRKVLKAAHRFTDKNILAKVKEGSIANVSAGVLFDYIKKDSGKKFNAILGHSALTNNPWLNDMAEFEFGEEDLQILSFSEESETGDMSNTDIDTATNKGGVIVSTQEVETPTVVDNKFFDEVGLSEDEVRERLNRLEAVEAENKRISIDAKCKAWQDEGKTPALVKEAKAALMADNGSVVLNLSEDGQSVGLTLSEYVERLVTASPSVKLNEDQVTDEQIAGTAPDANADEENKNAQFSLSEKTEIVSRTLAGESEEDAIAQVLSARKSGE